MQQPSQEDPVTSDSLVEAYFAGLDQEPGDYSEIFALPAGASASSGSGAASSSGGVVSVVGPAAVVKVEAEPRGVKRTADDVEMEGWRMPPLMDL